MSMNDELQRIEAALRGEEVKAQSYYMAHRKPILIGVAILLIIVVCVIV